MSICQSFVVSEHFLRRTEMTSLQKSATVSDFDYKKLEMNYKMNGTLDPRPKRGPDVKIIIQSLKMDAISEQTTNGSRVVACNPAKMFKSVIQHANDSGSMDTSLEYKPLSITGKKSEFSTNQRKMVYVDELREILKENKNIQLNKNNTITKPSKLPFTNRKNLPETPAESLKTKPKSVPKICEKFIDSIKLSKKMPASSTPYRPKQDNETNNNYKSEINLMTPSADVHFTDSDIEITDGDFNRTLVKCYSMTRASCRRMSSFRKSFRKPDCKQDSNFVSTSPKFERRSLFTSSFNGTTNRSSIVSTNEISPLRRQRNIKVKNSKLLNFFRSSKVNAQDSEPKHQTNLTQTCNHLSELLAKSDQNFDELGCVPILTKDNLDYYTGTDEDPEDCEKTIDWGDKFEFSYICEPSTSDIGEEDELDLLPMNEIEMKSSIIPLKRIKTPPCKQHYSKEKTLDCNMNSSPFRRSVSDPALIRLATIYNKSTFDMNCESDFNDPLEFYNCATANIVSDLMATFRTSIETILFRLILQICRFFVCFHPLLC